VAWGVLFAGWFAKGNGGCKRVVKNGEGDDGDAMEAGRGRWVCGRGEAVAGWTGVMGGR